MLYQCELRRILDKYLSVWYLERLTVIKRNVLLCLIGTLRHDDCEGARQSCDHLAPGN